MIVDSSVLDEIVVEIRRQGKSIGQCHGVFDVVHAGHVRHFKEAKSLVDFLIVSITDDNFVSKGIGRPFFNVNKRAEVVDAFESVDCVVISSNLTSSSLIELIKPDIYFKGPDYSNKLDDSQLDREAKCVESFGGEIFFTQSLKLSSSRILESVENHFSNEFSEWVSNNLSETDINEMISLLFSLSKYEISIVGDAIIDEYLFCNALGKSGKEPLLAFEVLRREEILGGAAAVARNLSELVGQVNLISNYWSSSRKDLTEDLIDTVSIYHLQNSAGSKIQGIARKTRYVDFKTQNKLFMTYSFNSSMDFIESSNALSAELTQDFLSSEVTIISDFGHGFLDNDRIRYIIEHSQYTAFNAQLNAYTSNSQPTLERCRGVDVLVMNRAEIFWHLQSKRISLEKACALITEKVNCEWIISTLGSEGVAVYRHGSLTHVPALGGRVFDRVGAGDALLGITSILCSMNINPKYIGVLGNVFASLNLNHLGSKARPRLSDILTILENMLALTKG
jgi:rfaE bifunctional protein nucleotidyltransferase chain/domain